MNIAYMFPFIHNTSEQARKKMMLEKRKMRILMRVFKILLDFRELK
jgi:hypothetical protein